MQGIREKKAGDRRYKGPPKYLPKVLFIG